MDWLTFWSKMTESLAWPGAAVLIAAIFQRQIRALLSRIRRGSFGGAEVEFALEVQELATEVGAGAATAEASAPEKSAEEKGAAISPLSLREDRAEYKIDHSQSARTRSAIQRKRVDMAMLEGLDLWLAITDPRAAILKAWAAVEGELDKLLKARSPPATLQGRLNIRKATSVLSNEDYGTYVSLRSLRNRVSHGEVDPTPDAATQYVQIARDLRERWIAESVPEEQS